MILSAPASAQPGSADSEARLTGIFSGMSQDTRIRLTTPMLFIEEGAFRGLEDDVVDVRYGDGLVPVELRDIRSLQVEERHPIQGALWGLGVGALVGSVGGLMYGSFGCQTPEGCEQRGREGALRWGVAFGTAGAIGGFLIGRYRVSWRPAFP